jgi:hypothetical protein
MWEGGHDKRYNAGGMRGRVFTFVSAVSLALLLATCAVWWFRDDLPPADFSIVASKQISVHTIDGWIVVGVVYLDVSPAAVTRPSVLGDRLSMGNSPVGGDDE